MPAAGSPENIPEDFGCIIACWSDDEVERLRDVVAAEAPKPEGDASAGRFIRQEGPNSWPSVLQPEK
jgi:hypothetical protein